MDYRGVIRLSEGRRVRLWIGKQLLGYGNTPLRILTHMKDFKRALELEIEMFNVSRSVHYDHAASIANRVPGFGGCWLFYTLLDVGILILVRVGNARGPNPYETSRFQQVVFRSVKFTMGC